MRSPYDTAPCSCNASSIVEQETARSDVITTPVAPMIFNTRGLPSDQSLLDGLAQPLGRAHALAHRSRAHRVVDVTGHSGGQTW